MSMKLIAYGNENNARANKSLVAASFAGVSVEFDAADGEGDRSEEFLRNCSPCGRNPVLRTSEGYLFEPNAVLRHIARCARTDSNLCGRTNFEASQMDAWVDFSALELDANSSYFFEVNKGLAKASADIDVCKTAALVEALEGLELWLENRTFLVGERLSVADIAIAFSLDIVFRFTTNPDLFNFVHCHRHYSTVFMQPKTQDVLKARGADSTPADKPVI